MENQIAIATKRSANIKGLVAGGRGLPLIGRIKIGGKGPKQQSQGGATFQRPVRFNHFKVVTLERDADNNFVRDDAIHKIIGEKPTEIAIRLPYNDLDLNFQSRYGVFDGQVPWCTGDGETALRLKYDFGKRPKEGKLEKVEVDCPCFRADPEYIGKDKCKWHGKLLAIVENASVVGGVWDLRTTSYHTTNNLYASLDFLRTATGGRLAGIPLMLKFRMQSGFTPQGQPTTFPVITVVFNGSIAELQSETMEMLSSRREYFAGIAAIEAEVRKLGPTLLIEDDSPDENADTATEFHPESQPGADEAALELKKDELKDGGRKKKETPAASTTAADPDPAAETKVEPKVETKAEVVKSEANGTAAPDEKKAAPDIKELFE